MKSKLQLFIFALLLTLPAGCSDKPPSNGGGGGRNGGGATPTRSGAGAAGAACEDVPLPSLPFPVGTSMGITQKPGCGGHKGSYEYGYDFNIAGSHETDNDLVAVASSKGKVVGVVDWVTEGCDGCNTAAHNYGWGNCVIVQVENSCVHERYCHLDTGANNIFVTKEQPVCAGMPLGRIGSTGDSTGPHLHWQRETPDQNSIPVDRFVEVDIPDGCEPCTIYDNTEGCFTSQNAVQLDCDIPPSGACEPIILGAEYPSYTSDASGCAVDNGMKLEASVEKLSSSVVRFHVRRTDGLPWTQPATLALYVGTGPTCGNPANLVKGMAPVAIGQVTQTLDLVVDPYDGGWGEGETKQFWIGKSEAGFTAARSTGTVPIQRECSP